MPRDCVECTELAGKTIKTLKSFLKSGMYKDVLNEPKSKTLYRGVRMSFEQLLEMMPSLKKQKDIDTKKSGSVKDVKRITVNRSGKNSSWSSSRSTAEEFASGMFGIVSNSNSLKLKEQNIVVVLSASVEDNPKTFLSGPDGLYDIEDFADDFGNEKESIALGPVKISGVMWRKLTVVGKQKHY